jgi:DNA-binding SARP family transcriptional activator/tetratricopeptide (TPR) repeat protein
MEFRLLGPVEVVDDSGPLALGGTKIRTLLAALLLDPGRVVSTEQLIEVIWDDDPPATCRALIQTYVSTLRRSIGEAGQKVIQTRPPGYLVDTCGGVFDRHEFDALMAEGRAAVAGGRFAAGSDAFRAAEALWRGPALGGARSNALLPEALRLDEQRLAAIEGRVAAELALGADKELVGELAMLVEQFPTRESLRGHLMLALHRASRTADALAVYRQGRDVLIDELGIEPGAELCALHESILRSDPDLLPRPAGGPPGPAGGPPGPAGAPPGPAGAPPGPAGQLGQDRHNFPETVVSAVPQGHDFPEVVPILAARTRPAGQTITMPDSGPAQLPPDPTDFTGREELVQQLTELFDGAHSGTAVVVVAGPGGAGKSALTVHVAHQVKDVYPDGQLHVDLRGTGPVPASPAEVLGRFLRALQVDPSAIPDSVDERMDAYRTCMSGRRMLVVLDDAANEQQVRPLLPGSATCAVLVASRSRLPGLASAQLVELDMLTPEEATALLARIAGQERIAASPDAAARIVRSCGQLPLAVRIAGARLASRRQWSAGLLADRLADERRRLDELRVGDQQVRASIEMSYRGLDPEMQAAFRLLGRLGVSDFQCWVVAALLDTDPARAEDVVEQLVDAQLVDYTFVDQTGQMRYRLHDLIRIYARGQAERDESEPGQLAAVKRVITCWLAVVERLSGHIVDRATSGAVDVTPAPPPRPADQDQIATALADPRRWLDAEQTSLILAVELAAELGFDELAVGLAAVLCASGYAFNHVDDLWSRVHQAALGAARRAGNVYGEAVLIAALGQRRYEQDRFADSRRHLSESVRMFRDLDDARGEAATLIALGLACREQGYLPEAQHFLKQAETPIRALDDDQAIGHWQRILGSVHLEQGHFAETDAALDAALIAYQRAGSRRGMALTRRTMGLAHRARGRLTESEQVLAQALSTFRDLGDLILEAFSLRALAKTYLRMGRIDDAYEPLHSALAVHRAKHDRWAEAMTLRTLGELELAAGRLDHADRGLTEALNIFQAQGAALFSARTLRDLACLRDAQGEHARAQLLRTEAIGIFRTYGAREFDELTAG